MTAPAPTRSYRLGAVMPHVRAAAEHVGTMFGVDSVLGWRASARDPLGHPAGLALDFMVGRDKAKGDRIAAYCLANADALGVKYVIWWQQYLVPGEAPEPMADRGSDTQNHRDHPHVQFNARPGSGIDNAGGSSSSGGGLLGALNPFTGWQADLAGVGVKLAVAGAGVALVLAGIKQTVKTERSPA